VLPINILLPTSAETKLTCFEGVIGMASDLQDSLASYGHGHGHRSPLAQHRSAAMSGAGRDNSPTRHSSGTQAAAAAAVAAKRQKESLPANLQPFVHEALELAGEQMGRSASLRKISVVKSVSKEISYIYYPSTRMSDFFRPQDKRGDFRFRT